MRNESLDATIERFRIRHIPMTRNESLKVKLDRIQVTIGNVEERETTGKTVQWVVERIHDELVRVRDVSGHESACKVLCVLGCGDDVPVSQVVLAATFLVLIDLGPVLNGIRLIIIELLMRNRSLSVC